MQTENKDIQGIEDFLREKENVNEFKVGDIIIDKSTPQKGKGKVVSSGDDKISVQWETSHIREVIVKRLHKKKWDSLEKK